MNIKMGHKAPEVTGWHLYKYGDDDLELVEVINVKKKLMVTSTHMEADVPLKDMVGRYHYWCGPLEIA